MSVLSSPCLSSYLLDLSLILTFHLLLPPPYFSTQIDDLMDMHQVMQGAPGYSQESVYVGDLVLAVDGKMCADDSLPELHQKLKGTLPRV